MSKNLFYSLLLLMSAVGFSQREVPLASFSKLIASDKIDVILIRTSDKPKILLNGAGASEAEVLQKGTELKIKMPLLKTLQGGDISATVFYNTEINHFEANEGARISSNDYFEGAGLRFIAKGGAEIQMKVEASKINVRTASGATISLSGTAKSQDIATNTGGNYEGAKLIAGQTVVNSNTGGNATINTTESADIKILAGGVVTIHGDPKKVSQKITGGGRIEQVK